MKISLLQQREDFLPVFTRSLQAFLQNAFQRDVAVVEGRKADLTFRMNAALNVIYPEGLSPRDLDALTAEYRYSPQPLKRALQSAYCRFAVRWPLAAVASPVTFSLKNPPEELRHWVFLPGNHTIRAIDIARDVSIVFSKIGFDDRFFLKDAVMRLAHLDLPVPQVLQLDRDAGWYKEARIAGLPLNRLADRQERADAFGVARQALDTLRARTETQVPSGVYAAKLCNEIETQASAIRDALEPISPQLGAFVAQARAVITSLPEFDLVLCQTHGDFQPANILYDGANTWLIDWEYSAERTAFYDLLVFHSQSRFSAGLRNRLEALLADGSAAPLCNHAAAPAQRQALLAVFLLEELQLKLSEVAAAGIFDKLSGLTAWLDQVLPILQSSPLNANHVRSTE